MSGKKAVIIDMSHVRMKWKVKKWVSEIRKREAELYYFTAFKEKEQQNKHQINI